MPMPMRTSASNSIDVLLNAEPPASLSSKGPAGLLESTATPNNLPRLNVCWETSTSFALQYHNAPQKPKTYLI